MQKSDSLDIDNFSYSGLQLPKGYEKLLIHCCCVVCGRDIFQQLKESNIDFTVFFYNPNIHPEAEYIQRKDALKEVLNQLDIDWFDGDYDIEFWDDLIDGYEEEPEGGHRCQICIEMRLARTLKVAEERGYDIIATTLGISRFKNVKMIDGLAEDLTKDSNVKYWPYAWRKRGGGQRVYEWQKREQYYQQDYCGCRFSKRTK